MTLAVCVRRVHLLPANDAKLPRRITSRRTRLQACAVRLALGAAGDAVRHPLAQRPARSGAPASVRAMRAPPLRLLAALALAGARSAARSAAAARARHRGLAAARRRLGSGRAAAASSAISTKNTTRARRRRAGERRGGGRAGRLPGPDPGHPPAGGRARQRARLAGRARRLGAASAPLGAPLLYADGDTLPDVSAQALRAMRPIGAAALGGAQVIRIGTSAALARRATRPRVDRTRAAEPGGDRRRPSQHLAAESSAGTSARTR